MEPWTEVLNATDFSPGCPQTCMLPPIMCPPKQSEDCLYLNVFVPDSEPPAEGWPVYVFIHGGAFQNGAAGTLAYAGFGFAENGIILVTMNYRLGAFGFLEYGDIEGNYGFQDQILSLQWVRDNIESFGGDNTRVTLGGESAGAVSVMCHMAAPHSQGLFSKAIIESSPIALPFTTPKNNRFYNKFVAESGCSDGAGFLSCMRKITAEDIVSIMDKTQADIFPFPNPDIILMPWTPTIGTADLPVHPYLAMSKGQTSQIPVLVGGNLEDARVFVFGFDNVTMNRAEYTVAVLALFGTKGPQALYHYPPQGHGDQRPVIERLVTDYLFQCLGRFVSEAYSKIGAYLYDFGYPTRMFWGPGTWGQVCTDHPCHGGELMFVFNNINSIKNATVEERTLAKKMNTYWSNFILSGDPNQPVSQLPWPKYGQAQGDVWMNFSSAHPATITEFKKDQCDFWDSVGYYREPGIL
ncbi:type B carboxylesterase [Chloropicon primus]|uniref:Carboxylic ester hydrolase n=1 Tax=Chloropicon primus TaxID=1764295 RepID=A0A5B8MVT8_9CHLO|nr:type B carboxylesterase [Chloropicon primus]UPR04127.1 type B carboxylesterase [Chloropicon primus]|eukprot:QDZ24918.1 type B carboxylesterase [Chloropicon primus]